MKLQEMNGMTEKPEDFRPEEMPPKFRLTIREAMGLTYERTELSKPPRSYYLVTQLIYIVQGLYSSFYHITPCEVEHQLYHYRHPASDRFLKQASWCRECIICPNWVYEHFHRPSKPCTIKCSARPVYRPSLVITHQRHNCRDHICDIPLWFHRRYTQEYPAQLMYTPFHPTADHFRISREITKNGVKPLIFNLFQNTLISKIQKEEIISLEVLFK